MNDVIDSSLGYALTYYHTVERDMYKEWMNEKITRRTFASMRREINCGFSFLKIIVRRKLNPSISY